MAGVEILTFLGVKKAQSYYRDIFMAQQKDKHGSRKHLSQKVRSVKVSFWGWPEESLSWTFPGMENKMMKVNVYTRASKVRLYLNDSLVGEKKKQTSYIKLPLECPIRQGN